MFSAWFKRRRDTAWERGYNYAAGRLMRASESALPDIESELETMSVGWFDDFDNAKAFDLGIGDALYRWQSMKAQPQIMPVSFMYTGSVTCH